MNDDTHTGSARAVVSGVSWLGLSSIATKALWTGSVMVLMHGLGPARYGQLATLWAFASLAAALTDLGAGQAMLRAGSRTPSLLGGYFNVSLRIKAGLTLALWAVVVATSYVLLDPAAAPLAVWWALIVMASGTPLVEGFNALFLCVLQVKQRIELHARMRILSFSACLLGFSAVVLLQGGALEVSAVHFAITLICVLIYGSRVRELVHRGDSREAPDPGTAGVAREGAPFVTLALLNMAYGSVDTLLLAGMRSTGEAGLYHAQYQLITLPHTLPRMLMMVMLPLLYRASGDTEYLQRSFGRISRYVNLLAWLVTPMLIFCSEPIMLIAGGEEFARGHSSLRVLSLMVPLLFFTAALDFLFVAGKMGWYVVSESIAIGLTILGGLLFVPAFSTVGMAAVAVVAYLISGIIGLMVLTRTRTLVMGPVAKEFARMSILIAPEPL
jgi:O-antigen/teichoic acid export membrane protein